MNYKAASDSELLAELSKLPGDSSVTISGKKKEFLYVIRNLETDEQPIAVLAGDLDGKKGTLILLTNINIHFVRISLFKKVHHDRFPLASINSCDDKKGLLFSTLTLSFNHQNYVFSHIEKKALAIVLPRLHTSVSSEELSTQYTEPQPKADTSKPDESNPSVLDTSSLIEKLELIEELKHFDVINSKEFNTLKEYVLASNLDGSLAAINIEKLANDLDTHLNEMTIQRA
ncbi:PH domain-containing protein [Xenorhabdus koppenhoeferi]|uniref:PH domain-containing protein n=1 Tax=Xenorhabdus koppenhoeferi TaxID=351659 RepID=UPI002B417BC3|nr:PH domain-containing protein [Xenorhabdus sp. Vera]